MLLIEWNDAFEIGITSVDYEHRMLIDLINDGYQKFDQGESDFKVDEFLGEIFARISSHFALEEKEMKNSSYDRYLAHKEDHENLLDGIRDMMDVYENKGYFSDQELAEHLKDWFTGHFKEHDAWLHGKLND